MSPVPAAALSQSKQAFAYGRLGRFGDHSE
jgi:hypothetical protein